MVTYNQTDLATSVLRQIVLVVLARVQTQVRRQELVCIIVATLAKPRATKITMVPIATFLVAKARVNPKIFITAAILLLEHVIKIIPVLILVTRVAMPLARGTQTRL